jgi:hypothetical protein
VIAKSYADFNSQERSVLVVCPTHDEIDRATESIRADRRERGELGECVRLTRDVSLNWTAARKSDTRNFRSGQFLCFHRAVQGITKNETVEVLSVEGKSIIVSNSRGKTRSVTTKQSKCFEVLERREIDVAPVDRLLITATFFFDTSFLGLRQ